MTEKKAEVTPLFPQYEKHKKIHDLVSEIQDLGDDEHSTGLASTIHEHASKYLHKNKGINGKVSWEEKGDAEHRKFSDKLWDVTADHIAKHYLKMSDAQIKEMKDNKKDNVWENFIAHYLGGLNKDRLWERISDENELTIETIMKNYVNNLAGMHIRYRHSALIQNALKEPEDLDLAQSYLNLAKKNNPSALKSIKVPKRFKSIDDAAQMISSVAQELPKTYHPDKKDTYVNRSKKYSKAA